MTDSNEILGERLNNLQHTVNKLESSIVNRVDLLLTTKYELIEKSLFDINSNLAIMANQVERLKNADHQFELQLEKVVKITDFAEYKKESREDYKKLTERVDKLESTKTFLSGSWGTVLKFGALFMGLLSIAGLVLNIYNSSRPNERSNGRQEVISE